MLADGGAPEPIVHGLRDNLHEFQTQFRKLIHFVAELLPTWREHPDRPKVIAEDVLSEHLCDFLNDEARAIPGIECFKFGREPRDETSARRNLDISAKPVGSWLSPYSTFDTFLPIECKRLPMPEPKRKDRDEREYLYDQHKSSGGIQRFKKGEHGSKHKIGAMIGYVQQGKCDEWHTTINDWVAALFTDGVEGWSADDSLALVNHDLGLRTAILYSRHSRTGGLDDIEMKHLWIEI